MDTFMTNPNRLRLRLIALAALATIAAAAAAASSQSFSVEFKGGRVKGDETLKVHQGDQVQVRLSSDQPMVLHLHGYDIDARVAPTTPALLTFKADVAGRFPMHEHREGAGNHRAVLFIEVHP
jgi:FtsP/CotA-like multicopper oxidase with cupredoxin domain